jgi:hypothetical protein
LIPTRTKTEAKYLKFAEAWVNTQDGPKAAKIAGYKGKKKTLSVTASKLLKHSRVKEFIQIIQAEIKGPDPDQELLEKLRVGTEEKRDFLWRLANQCAREVYDEDVDEREIDGEKVRVVTITKTIFRPKEAIDAINSLNEMDGDIRTPKGGGNLPGTGNVSIENLMMAIGVSN